MALNPSNRNPVVNNVTYNPDPILAADINAGTQTIELTEDVTHLPNLFVGYSFVDGGGLPVTPGAGTFTINGSTNVNPTVIENLFGDGAIDIDATAAPVTLNAGANVKSISITSTVPITGAVSVIFRFSSNDSGGGAGSSGGGGGGGGEVTIATAFIEQKLSIASVNSGPVPIIMPAAFLKTPRNFLSFTFVDVGENPVTPTAGLITFEIKTSVNPEFAEGIPNGTDIYATATPKNLAFASAPTSTLVSGSGIDIATDVIVRVNGFI